VLAASAAGLGSAPEAGLSLLDEPLSLLDEPLSGELAGA
jgi:hypothetical protein